MTTFIVPTSESVSDLLKMLYGDELISTECGVDDIASFKVATFVDDDNKVVAAAFCDIEFVVFSGAALSMIPRGGAEDMISEKAPTDAVLDNFHEVMNIYSKVFMTTTSAHLRLGKVIDASEAADSVSVQALNATGTTLGLDISIPEYGSGKIVTIVT